MNVSVKQARFLLSVVSINSTLAMFAYLLMMPKMDSWKEMLLLLALLLSAIILTRSMTKLLLPILTDSYSPRFSTRVKNQWWGVLMRVASGFVGLLFAFVMLPITKTILVIATAFYLIVVMIGFVNDGKAFDKYNRNSINY